MIMYEFGPQHTAFCKYRNSVITEWTTVVPRSAGSKTHAYGPDQYNFFLKNPSAQGHLEFVLSELQSVK